VGLFITTSVTGFSIPAIDTLLMNELKFNPGTKRLPLFGFGCLGGVASLNRAYDYLKSNPEKVVLVSAVEFCSLTFQMQDYSLPNLVGSSLFGDGAASVLLVGEEHPLASSAKIQIEDYQAFFYPNTQDTMGWNILDSGFQLILNNNVSKIVESNIPENIKLLLDNSRIKAENIKFTVSHPGGPKVLHSIQNALAAPDSFFTHSWRSLAAHGNMSSVSVLNVLQRELEQATADKNDHGFMLAMGPGFNSEISLIKKVG
jgi:alkylresorcinol/alkylpyrone synthase